MMTEKISEQVSEQNAADIVTEATFKEIEETSKEDLLKLLFDKGVEKIESKLNDIQYVINKISSYKAELKEISEIVRPSILITSVGNKTQYKLRSDFDASGFIDAYKKFLHDKINDLYCTAMELLGMTK